MWTFLRSESGAVTVDWVVLTAAIVGLGVASVGAVRVGTESLGTDVRSALENASVAAIMLFDPGQFNPNDMEDMVYWENPSNPMHAHWLQYGGHLRGWDSAHDLSFRMDVMEARHHPWMAAAIGSDGYALDMIGEPGQHLNIQKSHALDVGQTATVSFQAANAANGTMNVYWGNELLGELNSLPVNEFQQVSYQVTGGAGDGSNMLRFESTGGDGWRGVYVADVNVQ